MFGTSALPDPIIAALIVIVGTFLGTMLIFYVTTRRECGCEDNLRSTRPSHRDRASP